MMKHEFDAVLTAEAKGGYGCEVPVLPGCLTCGDDYDAAVAMVTDAARTWVASALKHGEAVPAYRPEEAVAGEIVHIAFDSDPSWIVDSPDFRLGEDFPEGAK